MSMLYLLLTIFWSPRRNGTSHNRRHPNLRVFVPRRPLPRWLPSIFTRQPSLHPNSGSAYKLPAAAPNLNYDCFELKDLDEILMETMEVEVRSNWFLGLITFASTLLSYMRLRQSSNGLPSHSSRSNDIPYVSKKAVKLNRWKETFEE
jgi:hypothetical protein